MACIGHAVHLSKTSTAYLFQTICVLQLRLFRYSHSVLNPIVYSQDLTTGLCPKPN